MSDCCKPSVFAPGSSWCHGLGCTGPGYESPMTQAEAADYFVRHRAFVDHPSSPIPVMPESWTVAHDRAFPTGCGRSSCYRCREVEVFDAV